MTKLVYTLEEYCVFIRDGIIELESKGLVNDTFNPRQQIKNEINRLNHELYEFPVIIMDITGEIYRVLKYYDKNLEFSNWIGDETETLSKESFLKTMMKVWPEILI